MRYLLILPLLTLPLSGCVTAQRYNASAAHTYLEARALEYHHQQEMRVHEVGYQLLSHIPNPPELQFIVVPESQELNAVSVEGKIGITAGMVKFTTTDDELAIILGHELAHHTLGHVQNAQLAGATINILAHIADYYARGSGGLVTAAGIATYYHFNQNQEMEADRVGTGYAAAAGYDPRAAATVWERMSIEAPSTLTSGFFNSHPSSPERMLAAQHNAEVLLAQGYVPQVHPAPYQPEHPTIQLVAQSTAPPMPQVQPVSQVTAVPPPSQPVSQVTAVPPPSQPIVPRLPMLTTYAPPLDPWATWPPSLNVVSPQDVRLRALTTDYYAGHISLEEYRRQKQELMGL